MSELTEKIAAEVEGAWWYGYDTCRNIPNDGRDNAIPKIRQEATDRIIAIIREALLSEQAVEAMVNAGYAASVNAVWGANEIERTGRQIVAVAHTAGMQAALAAAGLGGQGE